MRSRQCRCPLLSAALTEAPHPHPQPLAAHLAHLDMHHVLVPRAVQILHLALDLVADLSRPLRRSVRLALQNPTWYVAPTRRSHVICLISCVTSNARNLNQMQLNFCLWCGRMIYDESDSTVFMTIKLNGTYVCRYLNTYLHRRKTFIN
jgi:hypothetical protein